MLNKYVLLSGANGGIGQKVLARLLDDGYQVIALDIDDSNIKDFKCPFIKCDLTNKSDLEKAHQDIYKITDTLFAIVNTVGIFKMQSLIEGSEEDLRKIIDVNFFGIYSLNKIMFPLLKKDSRIINLTSELARYTPQPFQGYYNLSKILLDNYTDTLRREANYLDIKVIKLQSCSMKTSMLNNATDDYLEMVDKSEHFKKPLTKLAYMMEREIKKQNDPEIIAKVISKILHKKNPKIVYRVKNSFALFLVGHLPEKTQDRIYQKVIK